MLKPNKDIEISKKVKFNLGINYSELYAKKKSLIKQNINSNNTTSLTNTSISSQNGKTISKSKEKILLLSQVKDKTKLNSNRYAVLSNLSIYIYYSKDNYLLDKDNYEKVFKLKDYKFEIENKVLLIKQKEEHKNDSIYMTVKKYEFLNTQTAIKWLYLIMESLSEIGVKRNNYYIEYDIKNNIQIQKLNKYSGEDSFNQSIIENNTINKSIRNIIKEKSINKINDSFKDIYQEHQGEDKNKKNIEIAESIYDNNNEIKEEDETINEKDSEVENDEIKDKINEDNFKVNDEKYKKEINTKPSFRCLLKEEIYKKKTEENDNHIELQRKISENEKMQSINNKNGNNIMLSGVNSKNKNIYSFGKPTDFNSFHPKKDNIQNNIKVNDDQKNNSIFTKNINVELKKNDISNYENEDDYSESNDIKIKDLSQNNISINDMFNENKSNYSKNSNNIYGKDNLINLISCEKESKSRSDSIFGINNSEQKNSNNEDNSNEKKSNNEDERKSSEEINGYINKDIKRNRIRSSFLTNNEDSTKEKNDIKNGNTSDNNNSFISNNIQDEIKNIIKSNLYSENNNSSNSNKNKTKEDNTLNKDEITNNDKSSRRSNDINYDINSNNSKQKIFLSDAENNSNKELLNKNNDFNDINEIKMFDNSNNSNIDNHFENPSKLNSSSLISPRINNFTLENENSERKKIFLFTNESNVNSIDKNENECSYDYSNDIYTNIYENRSLHISQENNNYRNSKVNNMNNKDDISLNKNNSGSSIVIIDKNNPLLIKSTHYDNNNKLKNKIDKKYNKNDMQIKNEYNFKIIDEKTKKFQNIKMDKQENIQLFINNNSVYKVKEKRVINKNKILTNSILQNNNFMKNHFEFQYSPKNIKKYECNKNYFKNTKNDKNCQIQKIVNFSMEPSKNDSNFYFFEINKEILPHNLNNSDSDNNIKNNNNSFIIIKKKKLKNKSADNKNNNYLNKYMNAIKDINNYKNIYQKKLSKLKKNILMENIKNSNIKKPSIKKHSRNLSFNFEYEPSNKSDFSDIHEEISEDDFSTNSYYNNNGINNINSKIYNKNNDKTFFINRHLNNEKICNNITPKRLSKYINIKKNIFNYCSKDYINNSSNKSREVLDYGINNNNCLDKNHTKNRKLSSSINNKNERKSQNYTFFNNSFYFDEINNNLENKKNIPIELIENILSHRYSREMLLYCYNQGMTASSFFSKFQDNLEKILKNKDNYEITLKYLFEHIPELIRNRLEKQDLKLILGIKNNICNYLNNYCGENNVFVEYECCYVKEYIKKLIVQDNIFIIKSFNKFYDNISGITNKNRIYKYKKKFIQEMKNLNADIILS